MIRHAMLALLLCAGSLAAQPPTLTPRDVGAIADAALDLMLPTDPRLLSTSARDHRIVFDPSLRGIAFDAALSDSSLRGVPSTATPGSLGMRRRVENASDAMLTGCDSMRDTSCRALGMRAYVYLFRDRAREVDGDIRVWAEVHWASDPMIEADGTIKRRLLANSVELSARRDAVGGLRVTKTGRMRAY